MYRKGLGLPCKKCGALLETADKRQDAQHEMQMPNLHIMLDHNLLNHGVVSCVNPAQHVQFDLFPANKPESEAMTHGWLTNFGFF